MKSSSRRNLVLFCLFVVPLVFYILLQLGTHNFGRLPKVTEKVIDVSLVDEKVSYKNGVSVIVFAGDDLTLLGPELYNLNQKIYKKFYGYKDFQMIVFLTKPQKATVKKYLEKIAINTNTIKWQFVSASKPEIEALFSSLKTDLRLNQKNASSFAFLVDKELNLRRGESTIKSNENKKNYGYNMKAVAELKNDMHDDIKVLLAEYSLALKKNNRSQDRRQNKIRNEKN